MNAKEQTRRLNTMSMEELHTLKAHLSREISDTAWNIHRMHAEMVRFPVFARRYEDLFSKRHDRMMAKQRRLDQVESRIAAVGAEKEAAR